MRMSRWIDAPSRQYERDVVDSAPKTDLRRMLKPSLIDMRAGARAPRLSFRAFVGVTTALACAGSMAGCDRHTTLPAAPVIAPGEAFAAKMAAFNTDYMLQYCSGAISASDTGQLSQYSDAQITKSTCEISALETEVNNRGGDPDQVCVRATNVMFTEFRRRFPDHDVREVSGSC